MSMSVDNRLRAREETPINPRVNERGYHCRGVIHGQFEMANTRVTLERREVLTNHPDTHANEKENIAEKTSR
jgi:hypothetical protein